MALINLNDELNVDSDKLEIIQLDEAQFSKHHFFPNFPKIFIFLECNWPCYRYLDSNYYEDIKGHSFKIL